MWQAIHLNSSHNMGQTMSDSEEATLDRIDLAILRALTANARISMTDLGAAVGLSKTPVTARVRRLEEDGVITGYRAQLSAARLGLEQVAYLQVHLADTREAALQAFNKAVSAIPEVEECHMIAGGFDYLVKVRTRDIGDYRRVLGERISRLPHVASTSTFVSMESVIDRGASLI